MNVHQLLLDGLNEDAVDFKPTYDENDEEPLNGKQEKNGAAKNGETRDNDYVKTWDEFIFTNIGNIGNWLYDNQLERNILD